MSSRKTIAVDVDDVLATSVQSWVAYSNQQWGTNLTVDDYDEDWAKMWGVDQKEARQRALHLYESGVVGTFGHFEEAKAVLQRLAERYKLVITSSRVEHVRQHTLEWLDDRFGGIFEEIHLAGIFDDGHPDAIKMTKSKLLQSIGANYLIDDHPKHCFAAAAVGIPSLLFGEYVWNRNVTDLPSGVTRCLNWQEVGAYFDEKP
ncbi:MAG TPA: hypothetical protein VFH39_00100 [Candidatus Saccharimonadales bacterium]|nr:hypothetical protein [Candidatus Saccharimonadales bacterium]